MSFVNIGNNGMQIPIIIQQGYVNMHLLTDWLPGWPTNRRIRYPITSWCLIVISVTHCHNSCHNFEHGEKAQCCQCYEDYICPRVNDSTASNNYEKHTHKYTHTRIYSPVFVFFFLVSECHTKVTRVWYTLKQSC